MATKKMLFVALLTLTIVTVGLAYAQEPEPTPTPKPIIDPVTVATLAVLLGVVARILFPYWRKITDLKEGEAKPTFDYKFALTGVEALIEGAIVAGQLLPAFLTTVEPTGSLLLLFLFGFNYGWARTDINNRIVT